MSIDALRPIVLIFNPLTPTFPGTSPILNLERGSTSGDSFGLSSLTAPQLEQLQRLQHEVMHAGGDLVAAQLLQLLGGKVSADTVQKLAQKPQTPTKSSATTSQYAIKSGDTLGEIAQKNGLSLAQLKAANPGLFDAKHKGGDLIQPGEKVVLPMSVKPTEQSAPQPVTVKAGDTLGEIAARYGVTLEDLKALNPQLFDAAHKGGDLIQPGERVNLPAKAKRVAAKTKPTSDKTDKTDKTDKKTDAKTEKKETKTEKKDETKTEKKPEALSASASSELQKMKAITVTSEGFKGSATKLDNELGAKLDDKGKADLKAALTAAHDARFGKTAEERQAAREKFDASMKALDGKLSPAAAAAIKDVVAAYPEKEPVTKDEQIIPTKKFDRSLLTGA